VNPGKLGNRILQLKDKVLCSLLWVTLLRQGVGLGDTQRSLPTPAMLGFCDSVKGFSSAIKKHPAFPEPILNSALHQSLAKWYLHLFHPGIQSDGDSLSHILIHTFIAQISLH